MFKRIIPAQWAVDRFGRETADILVQRLPAAVRAAVVRQMDTHAAAKVRSRRAFGGAWEAKPEELERHLEDLPGFQAIRPRGRSFNVCSINRILLLPLQYAYDLVTPHDSGPAFRKINKTALELLHAFGPAPDHVQPSLDGLEGEPAERDTEALSGYEPDGIVFVYYAAHERDGLLKIGWGEIVNDVFGRRWQNSQTLAVPTADMIPGLSILAPVMVSAAALTRFDDAPMAKPIITPRTSTTQSQLVATDDVARPNPRSDERP